MIFGLLLKFQKGKMMKYIKEIGLAGMLAISSCQKEHKYYEPYQGETVFRVREERIDHNLWVQVVESERKDLEHDSRYKIFLIDEAGEKYLYLGFNSEADCRALGFAKIKVPEGEKNLCDYFPK